VLAGASNPSTGKLSEDMAKPRNFSKFGETRAWTLLT
jgi:hypothetical protein